MRVPKIEKFSKKTKNIRTEKIDNILIPQYTVKFLNDKQRVDFIKEVEKLVRGSLEYRIYVKYLQDNIDMDKCFFFTNISNKLTTKVKIEIHHEPFTLFDIVEIVVSKYIDLDKDLNAIQIADEVMRLHYQNKVGLIPLSKTVHELVHNGKIFIPLNAIYGDYIKFIAEYEVYIPTYIRDIMQSKIDLSKSSMYDFGILEKQFVYLDIEGFKFPDLTSITTDKK